MGAVVVTLRAWWWKLRGVRLDDYRGVCQRCGRTGQAHYRLWGCRRFVRYVIH